MQQASCLEGGPLLWILPLYLHINKKSYDDDDDDDKWLFHINSKLMSDTELSCKSFTIMCFAKNSEQLLLHKNYSLVLAKKKKKKGRKKKTY